MKHSLLLLLLVGVRLAFAGPTAQPPGPKAAPDLPPASANAATEVIVQFKTAPTSSDLQKLGPSAIIIRSLGVINAVHAFLPQSAISTLAADSNVVYISPNRQLKGSLDITIQAVNGDLPWNADYTGEGIGVAVVDSGISAHPDLGSRIVYSQSFAWDEATTSDLYGHGTHVAGIIGSSGSDSHGPSFSRTFEGIAPNVNLINLKALDQTGSGQESDVIAAIDAAIRLKSTYNIRVLNLSVGRPVFESYTLDPLCQAVEAAWKAGIVVVVAAGNYGRSGYGTIASPGNDPYVITVGATNTHGTPTLSDDTIASYSSKGPTLIDHIVKPDIVAPGNGVVSLLANQTATLFAGYATTHVPISYYKAPAGSDGSDAGSDGSDAGSKGSDGSDAGSKGSDGSDAGSKGSDSGSAPGNSSSSSANSTLYYKLSGTSMATPVVSGAAALLLQQNPSLTPDQVKARLMRTARKVLPTFMTEVDAQTSAVFSSQADIFTVGAGYLDINGALSDTNLAHLPALSSIRHL